jgi:hypothetical protein
MSYLMQETWKPFAPTLRRGYFAREGHLKLIVEADGRMVPDIELKRRGRREVRLHGKAEQGELRTSSARKRDR